LHRNALFTGRFDALKTLARALLHDHTQSLLVTGLGGVGKTQLAVEFAYRYGSYFRGVHWLNATQPDLITAGIAGCGERMLLPHWPDTLSQQVEHTLRAWHDGTARLIVLDNLEDIKAARQWLPSLLGEGIRLLLTTRQTRWPRDLNMASLDLDAFDPGESRQFLRRYVPGTSSSDADLDTLALRLGHLPLALALAGRYLDSFESLGGAPGLTVADYIVELNAPKNVLIHESLRDGEDQGMGSPTKHELSLTATFEVSWKNVGNDKARSIFQLAGHCAPNQPIPHSLLQQAAGLDTKSYSQALRQLTDLGLLDHADSATGPAIHPLLADYAQILHSSTGEQPQTLQDTEEDGAHKEHAPLAALVSTLVDLASAANHTGQPAVFAPLRPHVRAVAPVAQDIDLDNAGRLWNSLGYHLHDVAEYAAAQDAYRQALRIWQEMYGQDDPHVATVYNNLAETLRSLADYEGARDACQTALEIDQKAFGSQHSTVARDLNNLGLALHDLGQLDAARAAYQQALDIDEALLGPTHPNVAPRINNLASLLFEEGDLRAARAAFERALEIDREHYGPDHPWVANDLNNLGRTLHQLGDHSGARDAYQRALQIDRAVFGPEHPKVAIRESNLGDLLQDLGDYPAARAAYHRALTTLEASLPSDHPHIQTIHDTLASLPGTPQAPG
jgi:tetratricopeptide (TPR) repeat protein